MKKKNKSGFSLIEVVVALVVLLVVIVGGASVIYQTGSTIQRQQNKREAIIAANQKMDEYWSLPYDIDDGSVEDLTGKIGSTESANVIVNGISMLVESSFAAGTDAGGSDYIEIAVDINHMGASDDAIITTRRYQSGFSRAEL